MCFTIGREQAALKARLYQIALDDLAKAIELAPNDLTYRAELAGGQHPCQPLRGSIGPYCRRHWISTRIMPRPIG